MHELQCDFFQHARPRNQVWRILLGLFIIAIIYFAVIFATNIVLAWKGIDLYKVMMSGSPSGLAIMLLSFFPVWVGIEFVSRVLHKRRLQALYGPSYKLDWIHFLKAGGVVVTMILIIEAVTQLYLLNSGQEIYSRNMIDDLSRWCLWVLPLLGLLMIQIGAEEILFRGYLLQTISARGGNFFWAAALPSVLFGALHFDYVNFGNNAFAYVISTSVFGMILCAVTLRLGNLGAAFGLHFFNNFIALFIYGLNDELGTMALIHIDIDPKSPLIGFGMILQSVLSVIVFYLWRTYHKRIKSDATLAN